MTGPWPRRRATTPRKPISTEALTFGRQSWLDLLEQFRQAAVDDLGGLPLTIDRERTLRGAIRRAGGTVGEAADAGRRVRLADLPVDGVSAGAARDAFAAAAAGFLISAGDRRQAFAKLLIEAVACARSLLDEQARLMASRWQRQFGDD